MAKYNCTYCQNAILTCRIHCVECTEVEFDLCLQASHVMCVYVECGGKAH